MNYSSSLLYALLSTLIGAVIGIELTFELPDNANQCYYEEIAQGVDCVIEFQVVTGGQYDVDMSLEGPNGKVLYKDIRKQYDSFSWKTDAVGTYKVCFSNEFSTFSHKIVYMDWQIGAERALPNTREHMTAMTMMDTSASGIHERLKVVDDYQTHHRLRESTSRKRAEELSDRVLWWSVGQTVVILFIGISQVFVLRSFFTDKRPSMGY